ncbi:hypothetical protein C2845_PM07G24090 [Panicum miliaceum]|uniref:Serpin domain-containing protein n=1 Tax=Panicum miliaceum TaxID=4540 RepID=A0A3L6SQW1_PANMI|nr:hypothetical protein C2845_PM07G24090 [Panicum miliaceum]
MSSTRDQHIARRPGYKVLKLPYATAPGAGGQHRVFSMYIYLPDDRCGLPSLLQNLSSDPALLESSGTMRSKVRVGAFMVPKFTISCGTDAKEMLKALGLTLPFDPVLADLSETAESPPEPLFVSEVHHMSFTAAGAGPPSTTTTPSRAFSFNHHNGSRAKQRSGYWTPEPSSPKVSCIGQIKRSSSRRQSVDPYGKNGGACPRPPRARSLTHERGRGSSAGGRLTRLPHARAGRARPPAAAGEKWRPLAVAAATALRVALIWWSWWCGVEQRA